jgi:hypothetical protein
MQAVSYFIILYINEQYELAIHFAEHNFDPFGHIFFVIVLFEPECKTLFRVLFLSLCLQNLQNIYIFSAAKRTSKQRAVTPVYILGHRIKISYRSTLFCVLGVVNRFCRSKSPSGMVCMCIRLFDSLLYGQAYTSRVHASKNPIF